MGEYARRAADGASVKIGTCEDMYYLRFDQRHLVGKEDNNLDVNDPSVLGDLRFRFPFPDEDHVEPGAFNDHSRGVIVDVVPAEVEVYQHHVECQRDRSQIVQQRLVDGKLVTIMACADNRCGCVRWRLATLEDARPVIKACLDVAEVQIFTKQDRVAARFWMDMAKRIRAGYDGAGGDGGMTPEPLWLRPMLTLVKAPLPSAVSAPTLPLPGAVVSEVVKGFDGQAYTVEIVTREAAAKIGSEPVIRLRGVYTNRTNGPQAFDISFRLGDAAVYGSYNMTYTGRITSIGAKTVTIREDNRERSHRLTLADFAWRNWDYDAAAICKRNSEWSD